MQRILPAAFAAALGLSGLALSAFALAGLAAAQEVAPPTAPESLMNAHIFLSRINWLVEIP